MCTAATYKTKDFYFGRTLDYEFSYGEEVVITPRNEPFPFRYMAEMPHHFAVIGMACVAQEYPLYYDAVNEKGLGMAGLNFVGNACYAASPAKGKDNIAVFEFIPWVLGQCATVKEAGALLAKANLVGLPFNEQMPAAQFHWLIADREGAITVESVREGLRIYENPTTLLLNNKCLGLTIICVCLRKHRKIYFLPNCRYPHTAAGWAGSGCRAIYPLSPVLSGPLSLG